MEYLTIEHTDLRVSRLCMGGCPMGQYGWGEVREQELIDAVHASLDCGINFFDTADTYGLGTSERTLAKALKGRRDKAIIATKFSVRVENGTTSYDNSPEWITTACENSLKRLGTDYIDLYQVHYRDGKTDIHYVTDTLRSLQEQGKIRFFGICNVKLEELDELRSCHGGFATIQNQYSLACREQEKTILAMQNALAATPLTWGSLGQGILTGKYDKSVVFGSNDRRSREVYVNFHGDKLLKNLEIVEVMKEIAADHCKPVSAVAIRFILDHLSGSAVLCGAKHPAQILQNALAMDWTLSSDELHRLDCISR